MFVFRVSTKNNAFLSISCFSKVCFIPLCFCERLLLVLVFASRKNPEFVSPWSEVVQELNVKHLREIFLTIDSPALTQKSDFKCLKRAGLRDVLSGYKELCVRKCARLSSQVFQAFYISHSKWRTSIFDFIENRCIWILYGKLGRQVSSQYFQVSSQISGHCK